MIVGLDPGITTGIAILNSEGNVLDVYSKRDITRAEIIRYVLQFGNPVIISSDVRATPQSVEKLATKLGCTVFSPEMSLSLNEKKALTNEYYHSIKNDHEVDALAAAIKAWKQYRGLFSKVNQVLKELDRYDLFTDIILKALNEDMPNIEDAVHEFMEKDKLKTSDEKPEGKNPEIELTRKFHTRLVEKQKQIDSLHNQNILLSRALNEVRKELSILKSTTPERDVEGHELKTALDFVKALRKIEVKDYYPIIEFEELKSGSINDIDERIGLNDRVVSVRDAKDVGLLNGRNIKCLLTFDEIEEKGLEFPVIKIDEDVIENFDDIKAVKNDYIEKRLADAKKSGLIGWLKEYKRRKD